MDRVASEPREVLPPVALYVHIPFCVSVCPYCDFVIYAGSSARGPGNRVAAFLAALERELELRAEDLDRTFGPPIRRRQPAATAGHEPASRRPLLDSLYLGGGTPSLLPTEAVARIVEIVGRRYGLAPDAEITIEANPGPDERGDAAALRRAGVGRISFGAQSLDAAQLKTLGRRHQPRDVADALGEARAAGIASINVDLLYDLPNASLTTWMDTLELALALAPEHLSLYALTLDDPDAEGLTGPDGDHLPTRPGARRWREAVRPGQDDDRAAAEYHHAVHRLGADGWRGYEISNWSRPGHESRHNLTYWERRPYEAVGPGAHAFDGATRRWNAARLDRYVAALTPTDGQAPRLPPGGVETIDAATAAAERIVLGLRTDRGVAMSVAQEPPLGEWFGWALAAELLDVTPDDRVVLTTRGRLLSNELFSRLI